MIMVSGVSGCIIAEVTSVLNDGARTDFNQLRVTEVIDQTGA
jgi:hypothetical protein